MMRRESSTGDEKRGTSIGSTEEIGSRGHSFNHDPIFAAHPGRKRTLEILCIRHYWPGMRQDVENCQGV